MSTRRVIVRVALGVVVSALCGSAHAASLRLENLTMGLAGGEFLVILGTDGMEGPGVLEMTFSWGAERVDPLHFSALFLTDVILPSPGLPSSLEPLPVSAVSGATMLGDCAPGGPVGSCTLSVALDEPVGAVSGRSEFAVAQFTMSTRLILPGGYEFCGLGDAGCVFNRTWFDAFMSWQTVVLGEASALEHFGLFPDLPAANTGLRPIPEPTTGSLILLGLCALGWLGADRGSWKTDSGERSSP